IFKDRVRIHHQTATGEPQQLTPPGTASFCVAASAAEKRDYGERVTCRQPPSRNIFQKVESNEMSRHPYTVKLVSYPIELRSSGAPLTKKKRRKKRKPDPVEN
ncbi:hypothetical protein, partial [Paraburkholderia xenovorans]|uniref:hypothetical protein n=1 Tax=Paraburkholderia xenovorans TaxID=36873 RepID=UPI001C130C78